MELRVISLFPEMISAVSSFGVFGRAVRRGIADLKTFDPRDFTDDVHRTVDDRPYGGGPGMVLKVEPWRDAIHAAKATANSLSPVVFLSPQGRPFDQGVARELSELPGMILVAGRYEGFDERLIETECDVEISLGDFVLSGGEIAAAAVMDAVVRLLPAVLGDEASAEQDSFGDDLLDFPHYTRPERLGEHDVPGVLLNGNHEEIRRWRLKQSLGRTYLRRPDLLARRELTPEEQTLLQEFMQEYQKQSGAPGRLHH